MARSYVKVYLDFDQRTQALTEEEKGRLLIAMLRYGLDGQTTDLPGNERILWPVFQQILDRDIAAYDAKVENGKKGGRPRKSPVEPVSQEAPGAADELTAEETAAEEPAAEAVPWEATPVNQEKPKKTKNEEKRMKNKEKRVKNKNTPSCTEGEGEGDFEAFYALYPRKQGKRDALLAWEQLAPGEALRRRMLEALEKQKQSAQWQREGGRFIPYPATWLSGQRWEDEPGMAPAPEGPVKTVSAQRYTQRDYTEDELLSVSGDLIREARALRERGA